MNRDGLEQVKERLNRLRKAAAIIASNAPLEDQESAWLDLLQHLGTVYSKLEQAAKATPAARKWFSAKKLERKTDPLLRYLHHARNAGEHTIVRSASKAVWAVTGRMTEDGGTLGVALDKLGQPVAYGQGMTEMEFVEQEVMLHAALDRGQYYRPPATHLNQSIKSLTARDVLPYVMAYVEQMIVEAEAHEAAS